MKIALKTIVVCSSIVSCFLFADAPAVPEIKSQGYINGGMNVYVTKDSAVSSYEMQIKKEGSDEWIKLGEWSESDGASLGTELYYGMLIGGVYSNEINSRGRFINVTIRPNFTGTCILLK